MFKPQPSQSNLRTRRGQSIVIALLVLLLLGLVGSLFVTVVARNIQNASHSVRVQTADSYARAGVTYADAQLSGSADGADWRPTLQFALAVPPTEARELARYNAHIPPTADPKDPDFVYLQAGFARYNTGAGRYLVRVTYTPIMLKDTQERYYDPIIGVDATGAAIAPVAVPPGKYLKIEAIGREGTIDSNDPTTYTNNRSSDRTQATLVAYKPIGITDYARFETNPDRRSDIANLGVASQLYANLEGNIGTPGVFDFYTSGNPLAVGSQPTLQEYPVITTYGAVDAYLRKGTGIYPNPNIGTVPTGYTAVLGGGSIHSNMPLRFFGNNVIYLNSGGDSPLYQDTAEIGGDLLLDNYNQNAKLDNSTLDANGQGQQAALILNPTDPTKFATTGTYIAPSNSTQAGNGTFDTHGGLVRDGSMQNDPAGLPRSITRLEPPVLDAQDPASQMPRYRAIAMNSAPRSNLTLNGSAYTPPAGTNPSLYGYGKSIYVNNPNDVQTDSTAIGGGSTLTDEWLHRTTASATPPDKGGWNGLFYNPPGVSIVLGQFMTTQSGAISVNSYGIRLTRSSGDHFDGPDGVAGSSELDVPYSTLDTDTTGAVSDNDIIIYAEGNVRVRGILSPIEPVTGGTTQVVPRHITIVTNGTAYIEGNLLKGTPDSSISVLAHDYVCVNTTQFLAGTNVETHNDGTQNPDLPRSGDSLILDAGHSLLQDFGFGLTGLATSANYSALPATPDKLALYVAAGPAGAGSTMANFDIFGPSGASVFPAVAPIPALSQPFGGLTHLTFDLSTLVTGSTSANPLFNAAGTDLFQLSVTKAPGSENGPNTDQDVALQRVAVLPMDIRIEAVLYAQTRSFFVIPGDWFNLNNGDNLYNFSKSFGPIPPPKHPEILIDPVNGTRPDLSGIVPGSLDYISRSRFPLYGQPIDLKITISGSVSEAHPADIAAQTAWMQKWGWIPQYHGSLLTNTNAEYNGHPLLDNATPPKRVNVPGIGLQIIYDPLAGYPYNPAATIHYYLRSDQFGRPLPFTPKLPVSPGLLYAGQSGDAPLLQ